MKAALLGAIALLAVAAPALAGPPYLTDDPDPTDLGHWEIYAFSAGEKLRSSINDETGFDLNYGPIPGVQLTATLPLAFDRELGSSWRSGTGDVELGVKYRFIEEKKSGFSAAIFPRAILPTSSLATGERTQFLLPLWLSKDFGQGTTVFGGGGYQVNPGPGNRNFWQAGAAVTKDVGHHLSVGAEITHQGPDTVSDTSQTRAGVGSIIQLSQHYALLFSGGPTFADHRTGYHFYGALGLFF